MDASLSLTGLIEEYNALLEARDFEGAEGILARALSAPSQFEPFIHFQMGRLYTEWNKMTSAVNHLSKAAELAALAKDQMFLLQVTEELRRAKRLQSLQMP